MKKKIWIYFIGIKLLLIGIIPIFLTKTFQIGLESIWFGLGIAWILSGTMLKKETEFRPFDHHLFFFNSFNLLSLLYVILLKPNTWNNNRILFNIPISETLFLIISTSLSVATLVNHFIHKKKKSTEDEIIARRKKN